MLNGWYTFWLSHPHRMNMSRLFICLSFSSFCSKDRSPKKKILTRSWQIWRRSTARSLPRGKRQRKTDKNYIATRPGLYWVLFFLSILWTENCTVQSFIIETEQSLWESSDCLLALCLSSDGDVPVFNTACPYLISKC